MEVIHDLNESGSLIEQQSPQKRRKSSSRKNRKSDKQELEEQIRQ
jgi:hypothetical protein